MVNVTIPASLFNPTDEQAEEIENLLGKFGNARRRAYNMQNKGISESEGRKTLQGETGLNSRYAKDAWQEVETLPEMVTFGGLENQRLMENGGISVEEWHKRRNSILISKGDKANKGNVNLRVVEKDGGLKLRVNIGNHEWIYPDLYIPEKYLEEYGHFLDGSKPYQVLIKRKNERYEAKITVHPNENIEKKDRVMSIDLNSGFLGYSIVEKDTKELIESNRINFYKILDSGRNKTNNLIHEVVNRIIGIAEHYGAEVLCGKFNTGNFSSPSSQATRRIKGMSQFKFRKILKYKLNLNGIPVRFRSEAYTTILGEKLGEILGLDTHKGSSYAFALKFIDYHFFTFLCGALTNDGDGSLGEKLSKGSGLTALIKAYASGNGNLVGLMTPSLENMFEDLPPPCEGTTPRKLVGVAQKGSRLDSATEVKARCSLPT